MSPPIAIVGTGRSGSGFIAKVLTEVGVPCGHEEWWNPTGVRKEGLVADSSWCALAYDLSDVTVWMQIRNPFDVLTSFTKRWSQTDAYWPMKESIFTTPPGETTEELAMQVVVEYHEVAMKWDPDCWWRLEDLENGREDSFGSELLMLLTDCSYEEADTALATVPNNFNWHGPGERAYQTEDDLPDNRWKEPFMEIAVHYGYAN